MRMKIDPASLSISPETCYELWYVKTDSPHTARPSGFATKGTNPQELQEAADDANDQFDGRFYFVVLRQSFYVPMKAKETT